MALPCAGFDVDTFVDREEELSKLVGMVSFSVNEEVKLPDYQRVKHLVGKSKVGKSYLLCNYNEYLAGTNIRKIGLSFANFINLEDYQFIESVLNSLIEQIAPYVVGLPENRNGMVVNVLSDLLFKEVENLQKKNLIVFLLDEVSMLSDNRIQLLEDYLLARILVLPNVIVVLSGRYLINGWKEFALRPRAEVNVIELSGFDYENTQKQIQALNPHLDGLVAEIHDISGGSPGNNRKIVDELVDPSQFNELSAIHICNQELFEALAEIRTKIPDSTANELLPALEALCVLQDFDMEYEMPAILSVHSALMGSWAIQRCSDLLNILSKIQIGPGKLIDWDMEKSALAMEEQTRLNLEKELKMQNENLWKTLHCTAMKMYSDWAKEYGMDSIFADKAEYHKTQLIKAGVDPETCG